MYPSASRWLITSIAKGIKFNSSFYYLLFASCNKNPKVLKKFSYYFIQRQIYTSLIMSCNACGPNFSKEALKHKLSPEQYQVTQEKDTERAYTGKYYRHFEKGTYTCIVCNQDLFSSDSKYESKCGWPAFFDTANPSCITMKDDFSMVSCNLLLLTMKTDMKRTEALCSKCGAHLGHVFDDGPKPTGKRFCINSAALDFRKLDEPSQPDSSS